MTAHLSQPQNYYFETLIHQHELIVTHKVLIVLYKLSEQNRSSSKPNLNIWVHDVQTQSKRSAAACWYLQGVCLYVYLERATSLWDTDTLLEGTHHSAPSSWYRTSSLTLSSQVQVYLLLLLPEASWVCMYVCMCVCVCVCTRERCCLKM